MHYHCACAALCVFALGLSEAKIKKEVVDLAKEDTLLFWRRFNAPKCRPFTVFKQGCNQCVCAADGTTSCTRMYCGNSDPDSTHRSFVIESPHLREKEVFNTTEESDSD